MHKILIIEDDEIIAKSIEKELSNWGFISKCITDFQNIIPQFVEFDPQLILLDITFPILMDIFCVVNLVIYLRSLLYLFHLLQTI